MRKIMSWDCVRTRETAMNNRIGGEVSLQKSSHFGLPVANINIDGGHLDPVWEEDVNTLSSPLAKTMKENMMKTGFPTTTSDDDVSSISIGDTTSLDSGDSSKNNNSTHHKSSSSSSTMSNNNSNVSNSNSNSNSRNMDHNNNSLGGDSLNKNNNNDNTSKSFKKRPLVRFDPYVRYMINNKIKPQFENETINIAVGGGGYGALYASGPLFHLAQLVRQQRLKVDKVFCVSGGAVAGFFFMAAMENEKFTPDLFKSVYYTLVDKFYKEGKTVVIANRMACEKMMENLPDDIPQRWSGILSITVTELTSFGPRRKVVSQFNDREDILDYVSASCSIPYVTIESYAYPIGDKRFVDGVYPIIDEYENNTLFFNLMSVFYPVYLRLRPEDDCLDTLILRGIYEYYDFVFQNKKVSSIYFIDGEKTKRNAQQTLQKNGNTTNNTNNPNDNDNEDTAKKQQNATTLAITNNLYVMSVVVAASFIPMTYLLMNQRKPGGGTGGSTEFAKSVMPLFYSVSSTAAAMLYNNSNR